VRVVNVGPWFVVGVVASATSACFRGDFLDNTCEQLPGGCPDTVVTDVSTTTAESTTAPLPDLPSCVPDPQEPALDPPAGGELQPGPAFRVTKLQIVDPNFYYPLGFTCIEVTGTVGNALTDSLAKWETNLVFLAEKFAPDLETQSLFFLRDAVCDQNANYCSFGAGNAGYPFNVVNHDEGDCAVPVAPDSADPEDILILGRPTAPCFISPQASFEIALIPNAEPLRLYFARFAARYADDDCNPDRLVQGVMTGFIRREDAIAAEYFVDDFNASINLWQVILGSDANTCELPTDKLSAVDAVYFPNQQDPKRPELSYGVFVYLNIEAERLPVYRLP
jgi:hypothetical protein